MHLGGQVYNKTKNNLGLLEKAATIFMEVPKDFKRTYAYKISKVTKAISKPAKAGKIFQGAQKLGKLGKRLGPIGNFLSAGTLAYELGTNTWDAHTVIDGALLVVGIAGLAAGAPVVIVGIAVYGILDYAFGISEGIDKLIGRDSGLWDDKPISNFPTQRKLLFNNTFKIDKEHQEVKIDNTRVDIDIPKLKILSKLKN